MGSAAEAAEVAVYLRGLKARSNQSFKALARRAGVGSSTLHRYCSGEQFPQDFRVVRSFAAACGATADELRCLERLWAADPRNPAIAAGQASPAPPVPTSAGVSAVAGAADTGPSDTGPTGVARPAESGPADSGPADGAGQATRWSRRAAWAVAAGLAAVVVLAATAFALTTGGESDQASREAGLLFSAACEGPISMGQHDKCVQEVQRRLAATGTTIAVDADFGPETLRRVTAFQVLAGLSVRGVVDDDTKRALYAGEVSMRSWTPARVERRIREVFPEEPDRAVAIAKCQSSLDPFWVLPNVDTSRNWGIFQISDRRLRELDGTPRRAFDPEWNIWAARELWRTRGGFAENWPYCDKAYPRSPAPSPAKPR